MKNFLKNFLKKTPLYILYQTFYLVKWTEDDERRLRFYQQFVTPGSLVYDVGANVGNRTKLFLKLQAKVIAFEPQQKCADFLDTVFKKESNFKLVRKALGSKEGNGKMLIGEMSGLSTLSEEWLEAIEESKRFDRHNWNETQPCEITTLDRAIGDFGIPSFIKIDIENYEFEALSGLSSPIDCISIEFHAETHDNTLKCIDYMESLLPKAVFQISKDAIVFDLDNWVSSGEIKQILSDLIIRDRLAWGDLYIKCLSE